MILYDIYYYASLFNCWSKWFWNFSFIFWIFWRLSATFAKDKLDCFRFSLKEILESEGTYPLEDRQYWDIGSVLKHFLSMLCRFSVGYCETFASTAKCHADILQGISCTGYNFIFQDLERILLESVLIKIRKQISARAIQRFWRRKLKNKKIPYLF